MSVGENTGKSFRNNDFPEKGKVAIQLTGVTYFLQTSSSISSNSYFLNTSFNSKGISDETDLEDAVQNSLSNGDEIK